MITKKKLYELALVYGEDAVDTAIVLMEVSDLDGAWAMAMDEGLDLVAEVIEELMMEKEDV
jgi:hypothetical protein